jgi:predicted HicB family RNase H-like nuclease
MDREQTTLRLPADLLAQLKREAQERNVSFNAYVLWLIEKGRAAESARERTHGQ